MCSFHFFTICAFLFYFFYFFTCLKHINMELVYEPDLGVVALDNYNQELKYRNKDSTQIGFDIPTAGIITDIAEAAQGTGSTNRIGKKILVRKIEWKGFVHVPYPGTPSIPANVNDSMTGVIVRLMVVIDQQSNGQKPTLDDILQTDENLYTVAPLNFFNRNRFVVLHDECLEVPITTQLVAQNTSSGIYTEFAFFSSKAKHYNITLNDLEIPVEYKGSGSSHTDIAKNNIWLCTMTNAGSTTTKFVKNAYTATCYWTDN
jgi:hypothetical protein